ncbi:hypothetical protein HBH56_102460 [Parastagonospora nodorum]|nr:hypothetical protein HBH56_102460 [Parastagonospora nodorum]KAH4049178.1 hypothetical protein HBH49_143300 [Parastagonospora nodorum]KAH4137614.1 hypothetical protein HBH45_117860 [Parastagonospora nodorum]KAH4299984.1 hypothetical protein HBI01_110240 [Parastagonospora nodorum]KAH4318596.1 hypothetical protein HBI02_000460 [Parastagonospora nodorum]
MFYVNVSDTMFFLLHVQPSHLDQLAHEIRLLSGNHTQIHSASTPTSATVARGSYHTEGRIRIASMVEARGVREDRGAVVQLHAVDLEDGDQTGFLADACVVLFADALALARLDALVDARGPDLGVLAVAGVQGEVLRLLLRGEFVEGGLDIGREVAGDGDDEERAVSEDAGPKLDGGCGDAAVAFVREGADGIVWVGWVRAPRYTALLSHMRI